MKCRYEGLSNKGNEMWGPWVFMGVSMEHKLISFCRRVLKNRYKNYWIKPIYFDDRYIHRTYAFFAEVGVELYPKISKVTKSIDTAEYKDYIRKVASSDIKVGINNGVSPVCIKIFGVRYTDDIGKVHSEIRKICVVPSV